MAEQLPVHGVHVQPAAVEVPAPVVSANPALAANAANEPADEHEDGTTKQEVADKIASGEWTLCRKEGATSSAWEKFRLVKDCEGRQRPFVQCDVCKKVMTFNNKRPGQGRAMTGASTSKLLHHIRTCRAPSEPAPTPTLEKPLTEAMKTGFMDKVVDWVVGQLQSHKNVDGPQFRAMIDCALQVGAACGANVTAEELVPSATTITRRLSHRASLAREEMLPELLSAISEGVVSATTDAWTCKTRHRHYVAMTLHYIVKHTSVQEGKGDGSRSILLFISHFEEESATAENLLADMLTQFQLRGIDSASVQKIHFVTDDGSNIVKSLRLGGYTRSYCQDHLLNVVLQRAFTLHLNRVDLFGHEGGAVVEKVRNAFTSLKTSKNVPKGVKSVLPLGPELRCVQKNFKSSLPMLRYAANNFDKVKLNLVKAGRQELFEGVNKEDIASLVSLVAPFEQRAKARTGRRRNTLRGEDWTYTLAATEPTDDEGQFVAAVKEHIRYELAPLQILHTMEKCKAVVAYFKRAGLNSTLDCTLKQEVDTRWNSMLITLESFFKTEGQFQRVNEILQRHNQQDLALTADDEGVMKAVSTLLSAFKAESLRLEGSGPTIQFVYLSYLRLIEVCAPKLTDSTMLRKLRAVLTRELQQKYSAHPRHLLGLFLWPKFRRLNKLPEEDRARVLADARRMCSEMAASEARLSTAEAEPPAKKSSNEYDEFADDEEEMDEVDTYMSESVVETQVDSSDLVNWWQKRAKRYPALSVVARMVLATPATSAASERTFSIAGHVVNGRRNSLSPETLDNTLYLNHALRSRK